MSSGLRIRLASMQILWPLIASIAPATLASQGDGDSWASYGGGPRNTHFATADASLSRATVSDLSLQWSYPADGYISAPPSSIGGIVYFTDHGGGVHAVDTASGEAVWSKSTKTDYSTTGAYISYSRNTPAITGDNILIGSQHSLFGPDAYWQDLLVPSNDPAYTLEFDINNPNRQFAHGAWLLIINRHTGGLVSRIQIDPHPLAMVTQSPVVVGDTVYVGVSSQSSVVAGFDPTRLGFVAGTLKAFPCCTFYGSVVAVDISDATAPSIKWQHYNVPPQRYADGRVKAPADRTHDAADSYSGASVWGGQMAYDEATGLVYYGTGNNHSMPEDVLRCFADSLSNPDIDSLDCDDPSNSPVSIIALNASDGSLVWQQQVAADPTIPGYDTWNTACGIPEAGDLSAIFGAWYDESCPGISIGFRPGPDLDIGQGPVLVEVRDGPRQYLPRDDRAGDYYLAGPNDLEPCPTNAQTDGGQARVRGSAARNRPRCVQRTMVLLGQKSGDFWAWDAADGELIWRTKVSPGAVDGGFQWNAATDGRLIFASSANSEHHDWQLRNPASDSSVQDSTTGGFWSALDLRTGAILWQTTGSETDPDVNENHSELTVANGLVFAGSYTGYMRALSTSTGQELWRFSTAAVCGDDRCLRSVNSAPTIVGNDLYWGYGYTQVGVGTALGKPQVGDTTDIHLLKFSVPGGDD